MATRRSSRSRKARTYPDHVMGAQDTDEEYILPPEAFEDTSARKRRKSAVNGQSKKPKITQTEEQRQQESVVAPVLTIIATQEIDSALCDSTDKVAPPQLAPEIYPTHGTNGQSIAPNLEPIMVASTCIPQLQSSIPDLPKNEETVSNDRPSHSSILDHEAWLIPRAQHPWLFDVCIAALRTDPFQSLSSFTSEQMYALNTAPESLGIKKYPKRAREASKRVKEILQKAPLKGWGKDLLDLLLQRLVDVVKTEGKDGWEKARWEIYDCHSKESFAGIQNTTEGWIDYSYFWLSESWNDVPQLEQVKDLDSYNELKRLLKTA